MLLRLLAAVGLDYLVVSGYLIGLLIAGTQVVPVADDEAGLIQNDI